MSQELDERAYRIADLERMLKAASETNLENLKEFVALEAEVERLKAELAAWHAIGFGTDPSKISLEKISPAEMLQSVLSDFDAGTGR